MDELQFCHRTTMLRQLSRNNNLLHHVVTVDAGVAARDDTVADAAVHLADGREGFAGEERRIVRWRG